jgi:hypothetical protein
MFAVGRSHTAKTAFGLRKSKETADRSPERQGRRSRSAQLRASTIFNAE